MEAVVLAAGEGKRMRPLTHERPKVMLPVGGVPILERILLAAKAAGMTRAHLVVHYKAETVRAHFGDGGTIGLPLVYHEQGEPRGTGHALSVVEGLGPGPFLMLSGDTLVAPSDIRMLLEADVDDTTSLVGCTQVEDPTRYGALETDGDRLVAVHEKSATPPSDLVNAGVYRFSPRILDALRTLRPSPRGELELTDAIAAEAAAGHVRVVRLETWRDIGRPWDLLTANEAVMDQEASDRTRWTVEGSVEEGVYLHGPVRVAKGAHIKSGTYIEGPVVIGPDARIGPCAYIRGRTTIGARCHVGAHTEIKNTILMDDSNIPHLNYVGDSVIAGHVNLGAGTKVANLRHDDADIGVWMGVDERVDSGRRKMGVIIGDHAKTGINVSLDVGTVLGRGARLAPGQSYRGHLAGDRLHRSSA